MRSTQVMLLALSAPIAVIILGAIWGHLMGWDLTQPQAVVIAALISGPFLIFAAITAFRGQAENRREERRKFKKQMAFDRKKHEAEMELDNRKFKATLKEQRRQARVEAARQREALAAQRKAAAELEREKQLRAQVYELITRAARTIVDLRTAYVDIPRAKNDDYQFLVEYGDPSEEDAPQAETDAAVLLVHSRRADLSAVAAIFMALTMDQPYMALMALANHVGTVINEPGVPVEADTAERYSPFNRLYVAALVSMRAAYENPLANTPNRGGQE